MESGVCDSCGNVAPLFNVPHAQDQNLKVWHYCEKCKKEHSIEKATQTRLKEIFRTDPAGANNPDTVASVRERIIAEMV